MNPFIEAAVLAFVEAASERGQPVYLSTDDGAHMSVGPVDFDGLDDADDGAASRHDA